MCDTVARRHVGGRGAQHSDALERADEIDSEGRAERGPIDEARSQSLTPNAERRLRGKWDDGESARDACSRRAARYILLPGSSVD